MKKLASLAGSMVLLILVSGCEAPGVYAGGSAGVYGEYPTTYYGGYYGYPAYSYRPYRYRYYHPYDRDRYWDRDRHWGRHEYHFGHEHDRD